MAILLTVMLCKNVEVWVGQLLGLSNQKNKILTFLGISMGGVLLAIQAVIANKRAQAMEVAANAQAKATEEQAKANQNTERGQRQERLKNAIEHLGHDSSDSVRLGGAYELFHLAQDTEDLRQTVLDILCAHICQTTGRREYRKDYPSKPSEEIQSLLTLLFVQEYNIFKNCRINLQASWLNGADLRKARLWNANLRRAHLNEVILNDARLQRVAFMEACLKETRLERACLQEANLTLAHMQGCVLWQARIQGATVLGGLLAAADLTDAHLQGADLSGAQMYGVILSGARMQGAKLSGTYLQGAFLDNANFHGVGHTGWSSSDLFADRIKESVDKHSDTSAAVFRGALTREGVEKHVEGVLSEDKKHLLRTNLMAHVDKPPRFELPENSRAITGAYTEKEAEQWIAEYEEAMSEVSKADNEQ
ncbi:MAG: pentapeptide repeat-containing protein [Candidatus Poribacteria bacterium]|nr:pentapeptide repeat-containing protein [Candidatus Poribacteria bacterium]